MRELWASLDGEMHARLRSTIEAEAKDLMNSYFAPELCALARERKAAAAAAATSVASSEKKDTTQAEK